MAPINPLSPSIETRSSVIAKANRSLHCWTNLPERRADNLVQLRTLDLQPAQLELVGTHPALGRVTLRQLVATWTAHDLAHILQVSRVMAKRYKQEVGPWAEYLSVMR